MMDNSFAEGGHVPVAELPLQAPAPRRNPVRKVREEREKSENEEKKKSEKRVSKERNGQGSGQFQGQQMQGQSEGGSQNAQGQSPPGHGQQGHPGQFDPISQGGQPGTMQGQRDFTMARRMLEVSEQHGLGLQAWLDKITKRMEEKKAKLAKTNN